MTVKKTQIEENHIQHWIPHVWTRPRAKNYFKSAPEEDPDVADDAAAGLGDINEDRDGGREHGVGWGWSHGGEARAQRRLLSVERGRGSGVWHEGGRKGSL